MNTDMNFYFLQVPQEAAQALYEQNRGLRVLIRRLIAGQEVSIRPEDEPAPPAAPGPSLPRVAPVCCLFICTFNSLTILYTDSVSCLLVNAAACGQEETT
jgi:hypothetical protein